MLFGYGNETQIFHKIKYDLMRPVICYGEVVHFFKTFQSFYQITNLTYVLMDNFCPCLPYRLGHISQTENLCTLERLIPTCNNSFECIITFMNSQNIQINLEGYIVPKISDIQIQSRLTFCIANYIKKSSSQHKFLT